MFQSQVAILFLGYLPVSKNQVCHSCCFNRRWRFFFWDTLRGRALSTGWRRFQSQVAILFLGYAKARDHEDGAMFVSIAGGDSFFGILAGLVALVWYGVGFNRRWRFFFWDTMTILPCWLYRLSFNRRWRFFFWDTPWLPLCWPFQFCFNRRWRFFFWDTLNLVRF